MMKQTLVAAAREILRDEEITDALANAMYKVFVTRGRDDGAKWVGTKVLYMLGAALVGAGIYLIGRFGK
jgi:hypothetical protein